MPRPTLHGGFGLNADEPGLDVTSRYSPAEQKPVLGEGAEQQLSLRRGERGGAGAPRLSVRAGRQAGRTLAPRRCQGQVQDAAVTIPL